MGFLKKKQTTPEAPATGEGKSLVIMVNLNAGATDKDCETVRDSVSLILSKLDLNQLVRLANAVADDKKRNMALKFI